MPTVKWLRDVFCDEATDVETTGGGGGTAVADPEETPAGLYDLVDDGLEFPDEPEVDSDAPSETKDDDAGETTPKDSTETEGKTSSGDEAAEGESDLSDALLDRAVALGYTLSELKSFRSEKSLEKELTRVERIQTALAAKAPKPEKTDTEATETKPEGPNFQQLLDKQKARIEKMKADGYDDETIGLAEEQYEFSKAQYEQQKLQESRLLQQSKFFESQQEKNQQEAIKAEVASFESHLDGLDKEYTELFGKGSGSTLEKTSQEFLNRQKVWQYVHGVLAPGYQAAGLTLPTKAELYDEAIAAKFSKHTQQLARTKLKSDIKEAGSQALVRSNPASKSEPKGMDKVEQKFEKYFAEHE